MLKIATVGTSWITEAFVRAMETEPEKVKLWAVYSRNYEKGKEFADLHCCGTVYTDIEQICDDGEIDAVYVASPNAYHFAQSKMFLNAGKHVLCEKPATVTTNEMKELISLADSRGLIYMEALMARHLSFRTDVLNAIKRLGTISQARFDFCKRSTKYDSFLSGVNENAFNPEMAAGTLMDLGIYCVYPCLDWFGEPIKISTFAHKADNGIDLMGGAVFQYNGFSATLTYSKIGQSGIGSEIIGDEGTLIIPSISTLNGVRLVLKNGDEEKITDTLDKHELMSYELRDFCRYINDETTKEEYSNVSNLALLAAEKMEQMRYEVGINFISKEI